MAWTRTYTRLVFHSLGFKGKAIQGQHRQKRNGMEGYTFGLGGGGARGKQASEQGRQAGRWLAPTEQQKGKKENTVHYRDG